MFFLYYQLWDPEQASTFQKARPAQAGHEGKVCGASTQEAKGLGIMGPDFSLSYQRKSNIEEPVTQGQETSLPQQA